jgi:predicted nucleic acid-binding protein
LAVTLVVDASVAIKWFVEEALTDQAVALSRHAGSLEAPDLLALEVANTAWKKVRRGEIGAAQARGIVSSIRGADILFHSTFMLVERAVAIAFDLGHPVHDCLYLACAEAAGDGVVVTADRRLCESVANGPYASLVIHLLEVTG